MALRNLVKNITHREDLHPDFRLVLTMAASPIIPSEMVATGPTVVLEPPRGFRARLLHALYALPDKMIQPLFPPGSALDNHAQHKHWIQTVLSVAMYHAAICEVWMNSTLCSRINVQQAPAAVYMNTLWEMVGQPGCTVVNDPCAVCS